LPIHNVNTIKELIKNTGTYSVMLNILGVGKTSVVMRYIGKMFNHHVSPTIGASFFTCKLNVEDTRVKLQVYSLPCL
jgi:Ras-related protein Rab-21